MRAETKAATIFFSPPLCSCLFAQRAGEGDLMISGHRRGTLRRLLMPGGNTCAESRPLEGSDPSGGMLKPGGNGAKRCHSSVQVNTSIGYHKNNTSCSGKHYQVPLNSILSLQPPTRRCTISSHNYISLHNVKTSL